MVRASVLRLRSLQRMIFRALRPPLKRGTIIYRVKLPLSLAFRVFSTDFCLPMFTVPLILLSQFVTTPGFRLSL